MQDGRKVYHGFLHGIKWIMFHGHFDYSQKPPLGGRPNTKPRDHGTPQSHNRWFNIFYHVRGPCMNRNSLKYYLVERSATYDSTQTLKDPWPHSMILEVPLCKRPCTFWPSQKAFTHFFLDSHNFMVTAPSSCVKWPLTHCWDHQS